jgi:hypothetical protein
MPDRLVKIEVRIKTSNPDVKKVIAKVLREMELNFGDNASIGYIETHVI